MITLRNGNAVYNVEEIYYKPYTAFKKELIADRQFMGIYASPKVFVLKMLGNITEISLNKLFVEVIENKHVADGYMKYSLKEPNLIDLTDNLLIIEVNSWSEEYIEK